MTQDQPQPRLLLHACCGPCATVTLERLLPRFAVTVLWFNPNLEPEAEVLRRRASLLRAAEHFAVDVLEPEVNLELWRRVAEARAGEPEGGGRCAECILLRLRETAARAAAGGYEGFATTLSVGPQKSWEQILAAGERASAEARVAFLPECFRERGGFARSVELSKELGLYRQNYCGCRFSLR
jgi:predicted adenine nucleotide alpha hydrolase (AANH) superfamily ATPase